MIGPIIEGKLIEQLRALLNVAKHIVITCHLSPDGDAVGASLGLYHVLCNYKKDVHVVVPDQVPRTLSFIPGESDIVVYSMSDSRGRFLVNQADLIFCLDFNALKRIDNLGVVITEASAKKVMIDHHLDPDDICDVIISRPGMSSTSELIYRVVSQLGMLEYLDVPAAQCLYVGMMTDTGNFTYGSDYPEIYEIVADLVGRHIDKEKLYNLAMNTFSADCLRLQGYALADKMQIFADKGASLITLTLDELEHYHYKKGDTEGLVNKPLSIPGVYWSIFMREEKDYVKVSARSRGDFSVNDICMRYFNGGGHKNAAGGEFYGLLADAIDVYFKILEEIK